MHDSARNDDGAKGTPQAVGESIIRAPAAKTEAAGALLDYAIGVGANIPDELIEGIRSAQSAPEALSGNDRLAFDCNYRDLAALMRPVTVQTLVDTLPAAEAKLLGGSPAERWSKFLWIWTWLAIVSIVSIELMTRLRTGFVPLDGVTDADLFGAADRAAGAWLYGAEFILPFLYGALGACAFLLRACHKETYARTFDSLRRAEYLNRMLHGIIAGGAIGLFGGELFDAEALEGYGQATLGFLAGYNSDFLFTAVERVVAAFLPKVEAQKAEARPQDTNTPKALRDEE